MPLINGCKYSCEPCIRGHRATSCAHTDRILIEVRKPGRPLESCGHKLDSCSCGRLEDLFSIGETPLQEPVDPGKVPQLFAIPASTPTISKPRPGSCVPRSMNKVTKRPAKKRRRSSPAQPTSEAPIQVGDSSSLQHPTSILEQSNPSIQSPDSTSPPHQSGLHLHLPYNQPHH